MSDVPEVTHEKWISQDEQLTALRARVAELEAELADANQLNEFMGQLENKWRECVGDAEAIASYRLLPFWAVGTIDRLQQRGDTYRRRALALLQRVRAKRIGNRAALRVAFRLRSEDATKADALLWAEANRAAAATVRTADLAALLQRYLDGERDIAPAPPAPGRE
jgi:hypothetical protein